MSRKLFVGNLPYSVTSERLSEAFSQFGTVTSSKVIVDRETGRSRGFAFLADQVIALDAFNPQIAARFLVPLTRWRRQDEPRQQQMKAELRRVLEREGCSRDVYEIASKALA